MSQKISKAGAIAVTVVAAACATDSPTPTALYPSYDGASALASGGNKCTTCLFGPVTLSRAAGASDTTWVFTFPAVAGPNYIAEVSGKTGLRGAVELNGTTLLSDDSFRRESLSVALTGATVLRVTLAGPRDRAVTFQLRPVAPVTLDSVVFSTVPTLIIDGPGVSYDALISNRTSSTRTNLDTQGWILQPGAYRAAGGQVLYCGLAFGVLPPGQCLRAGNGLSASNTNAGVGTLVPGPALAVIQVRRQVDDGLRVLDSLIVPVTLETRQVLSVSVLPPDIILPVPGTQQQLIASVSATGGAPTSVVWTSSSPANAVVSSSGLVTGVSKGAALVTAFSTFDPYKRGTSLVSVGTQPFYGLGLNVSPGQWGMNVGATVALAAQIVGDTGRVLWASSNSPVAPVSSFGQVVAVSTGAALVTAYSMAAPWKQATSLISVGVTPVTGVGMIVSPGLLETSAGQTFRHAAQILGDTGSVTWSSSNLWAVVVTPSGQATAVADGAALLTARSTVAPWKKATALYAIGTTAALGNGVNVAPGFWRMPIGRTVQMAAQLVADTGVVLWSSTNPAVAPVSMSGSVTAVSPGTATIVAQSLTDPSRSASATIAVMDFRFTEPVAATLVSTGATLPAANPLSATVAAQSCGPSGTYMPGLTRVDFASGGRPVGSVVYPIVVDNGTTRCWTWSMTWTPGSAFGTGVQYLVARGYDALNRPILLGPNTLITITQP
jgi:uncharacterized protein YjdB